MVDNTADNQHAHHSSGSGFLARLRGQAEAALSKVPAYDEIQHQLRQGYVTANPRQSPHTLKLQLTIKGAKGVIIDEEGLARESKSFSKNILDFTRQESLAAGHDNSDLQDVGDRLAFVQYKSGELHSEYAKKLEEARITLKDIRHYENGLTQQRDRRLTLEKEIGKIRTNPKPDTKLQQKLQQLEADLNGLAGPGTPLAAAEANVMMERRKLIKESFTAQFEALQELGEKLAITATYGKALLEGWHIENAGKSDYVDGARTAAVRSDLESSLATWSPAKPYVPKPVINTGGRTSQAPSFIDSHATELAGMATESDPAAAHAQALDSYYRQPTSPPANETKSFSPPPQHPSMSSGSHTTTTAPVPIAGSAVPQAPTATSTSPFVQQLNTAPVTSLPGVSASPDLGHAASTSGPAGVSPAPMPTVAETGAPIMGTGGPSSGVLPPPPTKTLTKEEEARQEVDARFRQSSQQGSDLDRDFSMRGRNAGEQLPTYSTMDPTDPAAPE